MNSQEMLDMANGSAEGKMPDMGKMMKMMAPLQGMAMKSAKMLSKNPKMMTNTVDKMVKNQIMQVTPEMMEIMKHNMDTQIAPIAKMLGTDQGLMGRIIHDATEVAENSTKILQRKARRNPKKPIGIMDMDMLDELID